jgi:endonuclease YncB( thermonuclease family)
MMVLFELGKIVTVKCLGRDQYGRLIGLVQYKEKDWFFNTDKDISEELLKSGYASGIYLYCPNSNWR